MPYGDVVPPELLEHLDDVSDSAPSDGQALKFDAGSGLWVPGDVAAGNGGGGGPGLSAWTADAVAADTSTAMKAPAFRNRETVPAPADVTISGFVVEVSDARTAGELTVTLNVNGTPTALVATIDGTDTEKASASGDPVEVDSLDDVSFTVATDAGWLPDPVDVTVTVQVGAATPAVGKPFMQVEHRTAEGVNPGSVSSGAWRTRPLNEVVENSITGASLADNLITLPAGMYWVEFFGTSMHSDRHKARLYNVTGDEEALVGSAAYSNSTSNRSTSLSSGHGHVTFGGTVDLEMQHRTQTTSGFGFGIAAGFSHEIHASIRITKVG